jgi:hypothetical protein
MAGTPVRGILTHSKLQTSGADCFAPASAVLHWRDSAPVGTPPHHPLRRVDEGARGTSASLRPTIVRGSRKTSGIAIKVVAELAITKEAKDKW